jgi:ubiquinone/menaquinone biosynthesis C-methylase UbiE
MSTPLFDRLHWRDPVSGRPMAAVVTARTPAGVPLQGALRIADSNEGYPIVDGVVRATPELARRYARWLEPFELIPPSDRSGAFQTEDTVDSFGFQWTWNSAMRSEADLQWRVADRFRVDPREFSGMLVLDAGAGAGDQSRWLANRGADVVSVDLSSAIDVVTRKLRMNANWVGVQGDITVLPFTDAQFAVVYCEGVIQHTRNSALTVRELLRVLSNGGRILATHYSESSSHRGRMRIRLIVGMRRRLSRMERYHLLFVTGALAALAYVPGLRFVMRRSGVASYSERMSDFRTTWTNTFDSFGTHAFQRIISAETFSSYFAQANVEMLVTDPSGIVVARKR